MSNTISILLSREEEYPKGEVVGEKIIPYLYGHRYFLLYLPPRPLGPPSGSPVIGGEQPPTEEGN